MVQSDAITQTPRPGSRQRHFVGDTLTFFLHLPAEWAGQAWLRTSLGHGRTVRREIVRHVEHRENPLGRCWYDIPMTPLGDGRFSLTVALTEVGHFEAKAYFLSQDRVDPLWPPGSNTAINVAPADTVCANIIYNAFVRQFGPNKNGGMAAVDDEVKHLDASGYTVIPPSGTFRDLIRELDFIIGHLGCRAIQLLPIHPTPTTYARMGRFGSPYAALSFTAVDPGLADFDPKATPLEQFIELVDAIHDRGARIFIDIAINHTGWAASLHETHPEWLSREPDGQIETPGAWGVVWADLTRLDYRHKDLWRYMADVFLTWCRRGVDGFRCDAGYMIPTPAWRYIIGKVRDQFPNAIFLLEGLGGKISVTRDLLNWADFNWAYSELFQNYDRGQIERYLPGAMEIAESDGGIVHFAETHDNLRLAATSKAYARMRTALCALMSHQGGFAFANGVEWLATEKIDVHGAPSLNWGAADNLVDHIRRLNAILGHHPAFAHPVAVEMIQTGPGNCIVATRRPAQGRALLVAVNLDAEAANRAHWPPDRMPFGASATLIDLIGGQPAAVGNGQGGVYLDLAPGQVVCLSDDPTDLDAVKAVESGFPRLPARVVDQRLRAKALQVWRFYRGVGDLGDWDLEAAALSLGAAPMDFVRAVNPSDQAPRVVVWQLPVDCRREVMVPPAHFLLVRAPHPFRASIGSSRTTMAVEESLPGDDGGAFALFNPLPTPRRHRPHTLKLSVFDPAGAVHHAAPLLYLSDAARVRVRKIFTRPRRRLADIHMLATNGRGGMCRAHAHWNRLPSRYDALLAANLSPRVPEDRRILLTRLRAWVVFQGFSQEIGPDCLDAFGFDFAGPGCWEYHIPSGQGQHVVLRVGVCMRPGENAVDIVFYRHPAGEVAGDRLPDDIPVTLILRPDVEDRNFHETTKAFTGAEHHFPQAFTTRANGFIFHPCDGHHLELVAERLNFHAEPEWQYMVHHPQEAQRGQDPDSDLFSPGYFSGPLSGGQSETLIARVTEEAAAAAAPDDLRRRVVDFFETASAGEAPLPALAKALDQYIVRRDQYATVIAGYPWFLDWGRDTLIVVRGIIAAGRHQEALTIIQQFAAFERGGTIPNMIRGTDTGNRDTSDAPLWLFRVSDELGAVLGQETVLATDCGGRSLKTVLAGIARAMMDGTPNGIVMDPASGLLFSPAHFTWMDTNFPAGTPRQGYPIEIQALWHAALDYLGRIDEAGAETWQALARTVRQSILALFFRDDLGYLADCLHADPGTPAEHAVADDALRPNQLFALTLGAVCERRVAERVLFACQALIVPGAIRSLADRPVNPPLPVYHNGTLVNDPQAPYVGIYGGDEDTRRKPAYHNGTAWTWVFPSFCEAWADCFGPAAYATALAWLGSSSRLINDGCVGHMPEIVDGDAPHYRRGCDAQAWGVSELLRVWRKLTDAAVPGNPPAPAGGGAEKTAS